MKHDADLKEETGLHVNDMFVQPIIERLIDVIISNITGCLVTLM